VPAGSVRPSRDDYVRLTSPGGRRSGLSGMRAQPARPLAPRTAKAADAAAAYSAAHIAFLRDLSDRQAESLQWCGKPKCSSAGAFPHAGPDPLCQSRNRRRQRQRRGLRQGSDPPSSSCAWFRNGTAALEALRAAVTDVRRPMKGTQAAMAAEQRAAKLWSNSVFRPRRWPNPRA